MLNYVVCCYKESTVSRRKGGVCFAPNRSAGRKVRGPTVPVLIGDDPIDSSKLDLADAIGDLFDRLLSFLFRLCCVESESVCLSLSDECIWFWWSLTLSDSSLR